jgi:uncharacterized protein
MNRILLAGALVLSALTAAHGRTQGPSFDCHRATWQDEIAICENAELSALDRQLAKFYTDAKNIFKSGFKAHIRHAQREWLEKRHECGADIECLDRSYRDRALDFGGSDALNAEWCHEGHMSDVDCRWVIRAGNQTRDRRGRRSAVMARRKRRTEQTLIASSSIGAYNW